MDVTEFKGLVEEQGRTFKLFREKVEQELAEVKKFGTTLPETKAAIDAMNTRFDEIEVKLKRPLSGADLKEKTGESKSAEFRATEKWVRFGMKGGAAYEHMADDEKAAWSGMRKKDIASTSESAGGTTVPEDFQSEVIRKVANLAGVSSLVSHQATSRDVVRWPRVNYTADNISTSGLAMTWEDETDTVTQTDFTLGSVSIQVKKARALVKIDRETLEDSAVDIMGLLSDLMSDTINIAYDNVFTVGTGGKKPEGFMVNPDIPNTNSGSSGAFTAASLITLLHAIPNQYVGNLSLMIPRISLGLLRALTDSSGRFLWEPSYQAGTPSTILGIPIRPNEQIPAAAAGAKAAIVADFKKLYKVVDKAGLTVQRLDEKYADTDQVGFIYRLRVGGGVVAPWAGRTLTLT